MSPSAKIARLGKVGAVRGIRLTRVAENARAASEAAQQASAEAAAARADAEATLGEARTMFGDSPACAQARFWVEIATERKQMRIAGEEAAKMRAMDADVARAEAFQAVQRHERRGKAIADYSRMLFRAEQRVAENSIEDETAGVERRVLP